MMNTRMTERLASKSRSENTAWSIVGGTQGVTVPASYKRRNEGSDSYNPATGVATPSFTTDSVEALVLAYEAKDIDGDRIKVGDEKVLVRKSELITIAEPKEGDEIVWETITRDVVSVKSDPTGQLWIFQTRRTAKKAAA